MKNAWLKFVPIAVVIFLLVVFSMPSSAASPLTLISPHPQTEGWFGDGVAISGSLTLVSAYNETAGGFLGAGNAYVFNASTGALIRTLTSPNAQRGGLFGYSVAMSGNLAIVGAVDEAIEGVPGAGHAYVFNALTGALVKTLASPNAQYGGWFGCSVAISGTLAAVGACGELSSGFLGAGNAYVFNASTGALIQTLKTPNAHDEGLFGISVAVSGSLVTVGAYGETASGFLGAGNAYVFNALTGTLIRTLASPNAQTEGSYGYSVAMTGNLAEVGAFNETASGFPGAGNAYVFNALTGALIRTLASPNAQPGGSFGFSVAMGGDAVATVVGACGETYGSTQEAGRGYVYTLTDGTLIQSLASSHPYADGAYGCSVGIYGVYETIVGAHAEPLLNITCGCALLKHAGNAYVSQIPTTLQATLSASKIRAGQSVYERAILYGFPPSEEGNVTYAVYPGSACLGPKTIVYTGAVMNNGTVPNSAPYTFPKAGTFCWRATISEKPKKTPPVGPPPPPQQVNAPPQVVIVLQAPLPTPDVNTKMPSSAVIGEKLVDTATVTKGNGNPVGRVEYHYGTADAQGQCVSAPALVPKGNVNVGTKGKDKGKVPNSGEIAFDKVGTYCFQAMFISTDGKNNNNHSPFEIVRVRAATTTKLEGKVKHAGNGQPEEALVLVTVAGSHGHNPAGGTVKFTGPDDVTITPNPCKLPAKGPFTCVVTVTSKIKTSVKVKITATYEGDDNNAPSSESIDVTADPAQ